MAGATVTEHKVSNSVKTCWRANTALYTHTHTHTHTRLVPTFVRVHHALQHGDRVVGLQLQGDVSHGLHQVGEEVGDLPAVLQQHVAVLSVGEVRVAQVGPAQRERERERERETEKRVRMKECFGERGLENKRNLVKPLLNRIAEIGANNSTRVSLLTLFISTDQNIRYRQSSWELISNNFCLMFRHFSFLLSTSCISFIKVKPLSVGMCATCCG